MVRRSMPPYLELVKGRLAAGSRKHSQAYGIQSWEQAPTSTCRYVRTHGIAGFKYLAGPIALLSIVSVVTITTVLCAPATRLLILGWPPTGKRITSSFQGPMGLLSALLRRVKHLALRVATVELRLPMMPAAEHKIWVPFQPHLYAL